IWDDGYGISVPAKFQRTKSNLSELLSGFQREDGKRGYEIITVHAWDYPALIEAYQKAEKLAREEHIPCIIHVRECTQPQGHSTSGSHERYKSEERLNWEKELDGIAKFKEWILNFNAGEEKLATEEELNEIEATTKKEVKTAQKQAWDDYLNPILELKNKAVELLEKVSAESSNKTFVETEINSLKPKQVPFKKDIYSVVRKVFRLTKGENLNSKTELLNWYNSRIENERGIYSSHLYSESNQKISNIQNVKPEFSDDSKMEDGRVVLRDNFEKIFENNPNVLVFGEDSGNIGDVNQGLEGLQEKFGIERVADTGI